MRQRINFEASSFTTDDLQGLATMFHMCETIQINGFSAMITKRQTQFPCKKFQQKKLSFYFMR